MGWSRPWRYGLALPHCNIGPETTIGSRFAGGIAHGAVADSVPLVGGFLAADYTGALGGVMRYTEGVFSP